MHHIIAQNAIYYKTIPCNNQSRFACIKKQLEQKHAQKNIELMKKLFQYAAYAILALAAPMALQSCNADKAIVIIEGELPLK